MVADAAVAAVRDGPGPDWIRRAARAGLVARGLVYGVVGVIALQIAWGRDHAEGEEASKQGAVEAIADQPLGRGLLAVLAVGFLGYVGWRGSEALWGRDDEHEDDAPKATAKRAASGAKALVYVTLLVSTLRAVVTGTEEGSEDEARSFTTRALELPGGRGLVGAAGVVLLGAAVYLVYRGVARRFEDRLDTSGMGRVEGAVVDVVGTVGMAARGLVVGLIGFLLLKAALDFDPAKATGVDGTLRLISRQPYGQALLTATAVGILAFAVYSLFEARHRDL